MPENTTGPTAEIRVCMPLYRAVDPRTFASVWSLAQSRVVLDIEICSDIATARNDLVKRLGKEPYLLFCDGDMVFTTQQIEELYYVLKENPGMGAVAAHACRWDGSQTPVCAWRRENREWMTMPEVSKKALEYTTSKVVMPVDGFGTGLVMIDAKVFKKLPYPWFEFNRKKGYGEDLNFCQRMIASGYKPSVHFGVCVGHIGPTLWMPEGAHEEEVAVAV